MDRVEADLVPFLGYALLGGIATPDGQTYNDVQGSGWRTVFMRGVPSLRCGPARRGCRDPRRVLRVAMP